MPNADYMREWFQKRVEAGVCRACGKCPPDDGKKDCAECRKKKRQQAKARREKLVANGICTRCRNQPSESGKTYCQKCLDHNSTMCRDRSRKLRSNGLCTRCGVIPVIGKTLCQDCISDMSARSRLAEARRLASGVCAKCGKNPHEPGVTKCKQCKESDANSAYIRKYGITLHDVATMIDSQRGKCVICDIDLGSDFVVDHCHKNMNVRGILCQKCNLFLGRYEAEKDMGRLAKIEAYISK